ncbi:MAG: hypothetical protein CSA29_00645 [Desulfobacterales bacterium]|nr:MAG: hypothetical protein CSA29_00645 [Desulfobacterales bacterium]
MGKGFLIELDDGLFLLNDNHLERISNLSESKGCRFLVPSLEKSVTRVMNVTSEQKYAEVMVARRLQDEGEFDESVSVITHWKKRKGKNSTDIFFTALPSRTYHTHLETIRNHDSLLLLVPFFSILSHIVKTSKEIGPIAVVLRHGRYADLVIGNSSRFFHAIRCMSFDHTEEQVQRLWKAVGREISLTSREHSITVEKIIALNWMDAGEPIPDTADMGLDQDLTVRMTQFTFDSELIEFEDKCYPMSLPVALSAYPWSMAISQGAGKLAYAVDRATGLIICLFTLLVLALVGMGLFYNFRNTDIQKRISPIEARISQLSKNAVTECPEIPQYQPILAFTDTLFHSRNMPGLKDLINDLSTGIFARATVKELKIEYEGRQIRIQMAGAISEPFQTAHNVYQGLLNHLTLGGYTIKDHRFETRIESSSFRLDLVWSIQ